MTDAEQTPGGKAYDSNENMRVPRDGKLPRPATEPPGSETSTVGPKTATDPSTGEPNKDRRP
jgi:hypothetical protein